MGWLGYTFNDELNNAPPPPSPWALDVKVQKGYVFYYFLLKLLKIHHVFKESELYTFAINVPRDDIHVIPALWRQEDHRGPEQPGQHRESTSQKIKT